LSQGRLEGFFSCFIINLPKNNHDGALQKSIDNHILLGILLDKTFQVFNEYIDTKLGSMLRKAYELVESNVTVYEGWDASLPRVWISLVQEITLHLPFSLKFMYQLPGFTQLNLTDVHNLFKENIFTIYVLTPMDLYISDEFFYQLPSNIQYTRRWMMYTLGKRYATLNTM
jgi:hypothetical protein